MTKAELKRAKERFAAESKRIKNATYNDLVKETSTEQEARIKHLLKPENYTKFFDYYFGANTPIALGDAPCADFHQSSYMKIWQDEFITLFRMWYRGSAKSIHTNVGNIAHLKQNNELFFALLVGKTEKHAKLLLADLQVHFEANERYIKDFGKQVSYGSWADGEFETTDNRFFKALGINQPFRGLRRYGNRPDFASVDDVEDRKLAKNKELVQEYGEKITGDLGKAFSFKRARLVIPNNYIVKNGIIDFVLDKKKKSKHLRIEKVNLSDENGNPSWYQRLSRNDVERINADTDYYTSQREDYNNPIEEGKLFKAEWIRYQPIHGNKRNWNGLIAHWDLSYKKTGDFKACAILGFGNGKIQVLDVFCRKCDISEAVSWHFAKMKEYADKGLTINSYYDATAAQEEIFQPLFLAEAERSDFYSVPLPAHVSTDKHMRIEATLTDVFFNRILVFDKKLEDTPDMENAIHQILSFEKNTKAHDDFPDTLEAGVRIGRSLFSMINDAGVLNTPIFTQRERGGF